METIETLGKYEIKRTLGKGAMGTVYEGWDPIIARRVAIKTVRVPDTQDDPETEEALARFRREAQAAGKGEEAVMELQRALQFDPDLGQAKTALAEVLRR